MTLPTIAGVQSRIHALPGRPPFMTADDLAEFYQTTPANLMRQVRRNIGRFPDGFIFELTDEEVGSLVSQNGRPNKVNRGVLVGFTEKGALQLSSILTGPVADAVSVLIINAFIALRDQERSDMTEALHNFREKILRQRSVRGVIERAARDGRDYGYLRSMVRSMPQWELGREIRDSLFYGTITTPLRGTPMHLRQPEAKLPVVTPDSDPRQTSLFGEV